MIDPITNQLYKNVLNLITLAYGVNLVAALIIIHNTNIKYYICSISSNKSRILLANYFNKYPLFSSKRLNYNDWLVCHNLILSGEHLSQLGNNKALQFKEGMNNKRTYYN